MARAMLARERVRPRSPTLRLKVDSVRAMPRPFSARPLVRDARGRRVAPPFRRQTALARGRASRTPLPALVLFPSAVCRASAEPGIRWVRGLLDGLLACLTAPGAPLRGTIDDARLLLLYCTAQAAPRRPPGARCRPHRARRALADRAGPAGVKSQSWQHARQTTAPTPRPAAVPLTSGPCFATAKIKAYELRSKSKAELKAQVAKRAYRPP
jgi:hypothetical protein